MKQRKEGRNGKLILYAAFSLSMIACAVSVATFLKVQYIQSAVFGPGLMTTTVSGTLPTPPLSLGSAPVVTAEQPFGNRLTGINSPFTSSELHVINGAPTSYFQTAGEMLLNSSLKNLVSASVSHSSVLVVNGKPAVIYLGAISCIFCGENRWAMALALGQFGSFGQLFRGYSAIKDGDIPTIYWRPDEYRANSSVDIGNFYTSSVISFLSIEYASNISAGFQMQTVPYILHQVQLAGSQPYTSAMQLIYTAGNFAGTPYSIWGNFVVPQADATVLGNSSSSDTLYLQTHDQVLSQLAHPDNQFAWSEYAAADVYVALVCSSLNNSPSICSLPAIAQIEQQGGY